MPRHLEPSSVRDANVEHRSRMRTSPRRGRSRAAGMFTAAALVLFSGPGLLRAAQGARELTGVVLDPAGKPVAGSKLFLSSGAPGTAPLATSDGAGRFRLRLRREQAADEYLSVVAVADGFGLDWAPTHGAADVTLRLAADTAPVRGRVVDLEGRAIPGARVSVRYVGVFPAGAIDAWLADLAARKANFHGMAEALVEKKRLHWPPSVPEVRATTDAEGRFELRGLGAERLAHVVIEKDGVASAALRVVTREMQTVVCPTRAQGGFGLVYRGSSFTHHASPARDVSGTVRDAAGQPIAGVTVRAAVPESPEQVGNYSGAYGLLVEADYLHTKTDAQGRYAFHNLPLEPGVTLVFDGKEQSFDLATHQLGDLRELRAETQDAVLAATIDITGRVLDEDRKPLPKVNLHYYPASAEGAMMDPLNTPGFYVQSDAEGKFEFRLPEGRGVVAARAGEEYACVTGISDEEMKVLESDYVMFGEPRAHAALASVNLMFRGPVPRFEFVLRRAPSRRLDFVDPDGKPLAGVRKYDPNPASDRWYEISEPLAETHCEIRGEMSRTIVAVHRERALIGVAETSAVGEGPVRLQLLPAATLTGRLLDIDGVPRPRVVLDIQGTPEGTRLEVIEPSMVLTVMLGVNFYRGQNLRTDDDGRFRLTPLMPGWTYTLSDATDLDGSRVMGAPVTLKPGETIDLGDVMAAKE